MVAEREHLQGVVGEQWLDGNQREFVLSHYMLAFTFDHSQKNNRVEDMSTTVVIRDAAAGELFRRRFEGRESVDADVIMAAISEFLARSVRPAKLSAKQEARGLAAAGVWGGLGEPRVRAMFAAVALDAENQEYRRGLAGAMTWYWYRFIEGEMSAADYHDRLMVLTDMFRNWQESYKAAPYEDDFIGAVRDMAAMCKAADGEYFGATAAVRREYDHWNELRKDFLPLLGEIIDTGVRKKSARSIDWSNDYYHLRVNVAPHSLIFAGKGDKYEVNPDYLAFAEKELFAYAEHMNKLPRKSELELFFVSAPMRYVEAMTHMMIDKPNAEIAALARRAAAEYDKNDIPIVRAFKLRLDMLAAMAEGVEAYREACGKAMDELYADFPLELYAHDLGFLFNITRLPGDLYRDIMDAELAAHAARRAALKNSLGDGEFRAMMIDYHAQRHGTRKLFAERKFLPLKSSAFTAEEVEVNYMPQLGIFTLRSDEGAPMHLRVQNPPPISGDLEYLVGENIVGVICRNGRNSAVMALNIASGERTDWALSGVPRFCAVSGKKLFACVGSSLVTREAGGSESIANRGDLGRLETEYGKIVRFLPVGGNSVLIFMERSGRTVAVKVNAENSDGAALLFDSAALFPAPDFTRVATFNQCAHRELVFFDVKWQRGEGDGGYVSLALDTATGELVYVGGTPAEGKFAAGEVIRSRE